VTTRGLWTLIHEIPEGNWAGGGKVVYYRQVKGLVAEDMPDERLA